MQRMHQRWFCALVLVIGAGCGSGPSTKIKPTEGYVTKIEQELDRLQKKIDEGKIPTDIRSIPREAGILVQRCAGTATAAEATAIQKSVEDLENLLDRKPAKKDVEAKLKNVRDAVAAFKAKEK